MLEEVVVAVISGMVAIEVIPIRVSPLDWIGKRLTKSLKEGFDNRLDNMEDRLISLEKDKTKSKRLAILEFAIGLREGKKYSLNAFRNIYKVIDDYNNDIEKLGMKNGLIEAESEYIHKMYSKLTQDKGFLDFNE